MVKNKAVTVSNMNPVEYEEVQINLVKEGFNVQSPDIDSFYAGNGAVTLSGHYNRNQHTLTVDSEHSLWHPGLNENFVKDQILRVVGKEDATDKVQATPVMTPIDKHGQVIEPVADNTTPVPESVESQVAGTPTVVTPPTVTPKPAA